MSTPYTILNPGTNEAAWLLARRSVITATQAAAIAGSHPYTKMIDVWNAHTDPDYNPDAERNRWLEERAENGKAREPEILEWAAEACPAYGFDTPLPWTPNRALFGSVEHPDRAATPDGFRHLRDDSLELVEAKSTQQAWDQKGLPQHVVDQCLWQMHVTGARRVHVPVEITKWTKGAPTILRRWTTVVEPWPERLAFLIERVEEFQGWMREGIAPESDIRLSEEIEIGFDDDPAEIDALTQERARAAEILERLTDVAAALAPLEEEDKALREELKGILTSYAGRRVHLIGGRSIAKLVRGVRVVTDKSKIPEEVTRRSTSWVESETMKIEPNPEHVPESEDAPLTNGEPA